jgi:hypothetical protein
MLGHTMSTMLATRCYGYVPNLVRQGGAFWPPSSTEGGRVRSQNVGRGFGDFPARLVSSDRITA